MPSSFIAFSSFDVRPLLLFYCLCLGLDDLCVFWIWVLLVTPPQSSSSLPSCSSQWLSIAKQESLLLCPSSIPLRILWSENSVHLLCSDLLVNPPFFSLFFIRLTLAHVSSLKQAPLVFPKSVLHQLFSPFLKSSITSFVHRFRLPLARSILRFSSS